MQSGTLIRRKLSVRIPPQKGRWNMLSVLWHMLHTVLSWVLSIWLIRSPFFCVFSRVVADLNVLGNFHKLLDSHRSIDHAVHHFHELCGVCEPRDGHFSDFIPNKLSLDGHIVRKHEWPDWWCCWQQCCWIPARESLHSDFLSFSGSSHMYVYSFYSKFWVKIFIRVKFFTGDE